MEFLIFASAMGLMAAAGVSSRGCKRSDPPAPTPATGSSSIPTRGAQPLMGQTSAEEAFTTPTLRALFASPPAESIYSRAEGIWRPGLDTTTFYNDMSRYDVAPLRREEAVANMGLLDQLGECNPQSTIMDPTVAEALKTDPIRRNEEAQFAGLTPEFLRVMTQDPSQNSFEQIMSQVNFSTPEKLQMEEDMMREDAEKRSHFKDIYTQYALQNAADSEIWSNDFNKNAAMLFERQRQLGSAVPYSTYTGGEKPFQWVDLGKMGTGYNALYQVPYGHQ